jgi:VWFA-related protein
MIRKRHAVFGSWSVLLIVAVSAVTAARQDRGAATGQPPVTFRVDVNYVEVDAVVTDAGGALVRDLTKADFRIFEDGTPQEVATFALVDVPVTGADRPGVADRTLEPDTFSNEQPFEGRLYVLLLDDYHTFALRTQRVKAAARRFVEQHLGPHDLAAVVHTSGRPEASQDFTNNRRLLIAAIEKFVGRKTEIGAMQRFDISDRNAELMLQDGRVVDPTDVEQGLEAQAAMRAIRDVARLLEGIRGRRKGIVLLSEGLDYNIYDLFRARYASVVHEDVRQAIAAATRSNTAIYTVDPRGLTSVRDDIDVYELPDDTTLSVAGSLNRLLLSQLSLRTLAGETGGIAALNSNDFAGAFDRIVRDSSTYYLLGYYPSNTTRDGRFRQIEVSVTRPDLRVRARKGYVAPRGNLPERNRTDAAPGTSPELREALSTPLPSSGLVVRVSPALFVGARPKTSVAIIVEIDGRRLAFKEANGRLQNTIELSLIAIDQHGKIHDGARQTAEMALRPETYQAVTASGVRMIPRVNLAPGLYQVRAGVRESGEGRVGSVTFDLDVPDFGASPVSMSSLVLTSQRAASMPTAQPDQELGKLLPAQPTTVREFDRTDLVVVFAEVYDNDHSRPHEVDIRTTLRAQDGPIVFEANDQRTTRDLEGVRGGWGHQALIPLRDVSPGVYVLRVEARRRLAQADGVLRETLLRVR